MKRRLLTVLCLASIACASSVHDNGSKPAKEDPDHDTVLSEGEDCDEHDLLCIEEKSLYPVTVSVEHDIQSDSWEHKQNVLKKTSRIKVVGRHMNEDRVQMAFKRISSLPNLRHLIVQPNTLREGDKFFLRMRTISWLLSSKSSNNLETLLMHDLDLYNDKDVERLATSVSNCVSLKSIELRRINIGKRITSLKPIFEAISKLDTLSEITVEMMSVVGGEEYLRGHVEDGMTGLLMGGRSGGGGKNNPLLGKKTEVVRNGVVRNGKYFVLSNVEEKLRPVAAKEPVVVLPVEVETKEVEEHDVDGPGRVEHGEL